MTRHSEYKVKACQRWGAVDKFLVCASCSCASVASTRPGFTSLLFHFLIKQVRRPEFNNYENFLAYCTRIFLLLRETDKEDHAPIRAPTPHSSRTRSCSRKLHSAWQEAASVTHLRCKENGAAAPSYQNLHRGGHTTRCSLPLALSTPHNP